MKEYTVSVTFDEEERKILSELCKRSGLTKSDVLKCLIRDEAVRVQSNGKMRYISARLRAADIEELDRLCEMFSMNRDQMIQSLIKERRGEIS